MTSPSDPPPAAPRRRGTLDLLVRLGVGVFAVGLVAVLATVVPFFLGHTDRPTWLSATAGVCLPLGLGLALTGLLLESRRGRG